MEEAAGEHEAGAGRGSRLHLTGWDECQELSARALHVKGAAPEASTATPRAQAAVLSPRGQPGLLDPCLFLGVWYRHLTLGLRHAWELPSWPAQGVTCSLTGGPAASALPTVGVQPRLSPLPCSWGSLPPGPGDEGVKGSP